MCPAQPGPGPLHSFSSGRQSCLNVLSAVSRWSPPNLPKHLFKAPTVPSRRSNSLLPSALLTRTELRSLFLPSTHTKEHSISRVPATCTLHTRSLLPAMSFPTSGESTSSTHQQSPGYRDKGPSICQEAGTNGACYLLGTARQLWWAPFVIVPSDPRLLVFTPLCNPCSCV